MLVDPGNSEAVAAAMVLASLLLGDEGMGSETDSWRCAVYEGLPVGSALDNLSQWCFFLMFFTCLP